MAGLASGIGQGFSSKLTQPQLVHQAPLPDEWRCHFEVVYRAGIGNGMDMLASTISVRRGKPVSRYRSG